MSAPVPGLPIGIVSPIVTANRVTTASARNRAQ